jgi:predicted RNA-binding Zn-ribbon protein involved in translation (DUF1610 family)
MVKHSCIICGADVDVDERLCERHKNIEICENCGKPLLRISERNVINYYEWDEDGYSLTDICYDFAEYYCPYCGTEIKGEQLRRIVEELLK